MCPVPHEIVGRGRYLLWHEIRVMIAAYMVFEVANTSGGIFTMDMMVRFSAAKGIR